MNSIRNVNMVGRAERWTEKIYIVTLGSQAAIKKLLAELCPITFQQLVVLLHFIVLVVLWFFREPRCVEVRTLLVTILRNNTSFPDSCPVGEPGGG